MKKQLIIAAVITLALLCGCSSLPEPKKPANDETYYNKALDFQKRKNYFDAIPAFEELREKFPLSPYSVMAELRLGECHYFKEEFVEATHFFENFRRLHPSNQHVPYSIFMTGMCHYQQILSIDRDQTAAREAVEQFQLLLELYPKSPYAGKALCKITEAKYRIAEHEFFVGQFYTKKSNYPGAIDRYTKVLKQYPHAIDREKLFFYLAEATILSGNKDRGTKILKLLLKKYPDGNYTGEAQALLALHTPGAPSPNPETAGSEPQASDAK